MKYGVAAFGLTAAIAFAFVPVAAQAAKVCKNTVQVPHSSYYPTEGLAKANAEVRWGVAVTRKYSLQWANWGNANSRKHICKTRTTVVGANGYRCRARAKPCIYQ